MTYEEAMSHYYAAEDRVRASVKGTDEYLEARLDRAHWREVAEDIRRTGVMAVYTPRKVEGVNDDL